MDIPNLQYLPITLRWKNHGGAGRHTCCEWVRCTCLTVGQTSCVLQGHKTHSKLEECVQFWSGWLVCKVISFCTNPHPLQSFFLKGLPGRKESCDKSSTTFLVMPTSQWVLNDPFSVTSCSQSWGWPDFQLGLFDCYFVLGAARPHEPIAGVRECSHLALCAVFSRGQGWARFFLKQRRPEMLPSFHESFWNWAIEQRVFGAVKKGCLGELVL